MLESITSNIDLWTSTLLTKSTAGRGKNGRLEAYGIKKLRELILELAVRGKLVPQNPTDKPARALLGEIEKEKSRLIKEGIIRKEEAFSEISEDDKPYQIPKSWEWASLTDLYYSISPSGNKIKTSEITDVGKYPVIDQGKSYIAGYTNETELLIEIPGPIVIFGDHTTEMKFIDFDFVAGADGTKILRPYRMDEKYFYLYLKSYKLENRGYARHFKVLNDNLMALPPLSEQHRIVAKVEELLALCDHLEQEQTHSIEAHQTLVETLLGTLTNVEQQQELTEAWSRIASHFDTLFNTEYSIDQLRQVILQLAVMGKLVPQDPNDEPARVLLERVAEEKERLVKTGAIKKEKPLPEITADEKLYEVPKHWEYARFGWLVNFRSELVKPDDYMDLDQVAPDLIEKGTGKLLYRRTVSESGVSGPNNKFYTGQIIYSKIRPSLSKAIIAQFDGLCSADMYPLDAMIDADFLLKAILSEQFLEQVRIAENRIKMPKLNVDSLSRIVVPLPPLSEQRRIVAKVDELMALCDALKARLTDAQSTQILLADAFVEQAVT